MEIEITPAETAELLKTNSVKLLDVRTPEEYAIARIEGSVLVDQTLAQEILQSWPSSLSCEAAAVCSPGRQPGVMN